MSSAFANAFVLTGPTACGKSDLALELAERVGAEIVAMDSMTLYRGMDIGTAKPTAADRARIPHHLIDVLDPWESATVAWWLDRAAAACREITARGMRPLLVGGTPFYLKSLLHGLFQGPPGDADFRRRLEQEGEDDTGRARLHARLAEVDPKTAARLHPNDIRRVARALEVFEVTGKPISAWQQTWDTPAFAPGSHPPAAVPCVVLELPRDVLYERINRRVQVMIDAGWVDEVRRLQELPRSLSREASQALGYREILAHLAGNGPPWAETVGRIQTHTRQFAKRQLTWFRHLPACRPVPADAPDRADRAAAIWQETADFSPIRN